MTDDNLGFGTNPYLEPSIDAALGDTVRAYNLAITPAFNSAMVRSGSFGNSGIDQMNTESRRQLQTSLGRQANGMRMNDYQFNQQFGRQLYNDSWGMQQQQFGNAMNLLQMQNAAQTQNLGLGSQIQDTPLNYYRGFQSMANGLGNNFASQGTTQSAPGSPFMGALAGWQAGSAWGTPRNSMGNPVYNASTGSGGWGSGSLGDFFYRGSGGSGD